MCVSSEIPKGFGLFQVQTGGHKTSRMKEEEELAALLNPEGYHQYIPGQRRDIQYVSRLDCVQVCTLFVLHLFNLSAPHISSYQLILGIYPNSVRGAQESTPKQKSSAHRFQ